MMSKILVTYATRTGSTAEVAAGIAEVLRAWIRTKRLAAYKPGKSYLVKRHDLDKFLEDSRTMPEDES